MLEYCWRALNPNIQDEHTQGENASEAIQSIDWALRRWAKAFWQGNNNDTAQASVRAGRTLNDVIADPERVSLLIEAYSTMLTNLGIDINNAINATEREHYASAEITSSLPWEPETIPGETAVSYTGTHLLLRMRDLKCSVRKSLLSLKP